MTKWNNILPSMMKVAFGFLGFKAYASFGKNEITERIAVLVDFVKLVWNDDMFIYSGERRKFSWGLILL